MEDQVIGTVERFGHLLEQEHPTDGVALSGALEEDRDGNLVPEGPVYHPSRLYEKDGLVMVAFD